MDSFAIVAIGYNRPKSMERLLKSLSNAEYFGDRVTLIISIDKSGNDDVYDVADKFDWIYGEKVIKTYEKRMGLRDHVLKCGDLVNEYENLAVFEDDIYVSPNFYNYAKQVIKFYKDEERVAGFSLYNHLWNVNCNRPFSSVEDQFDTYFIQFAQSWGQVWTKDRWNDFRKWYNVNKDKKLESISIPENVSGWPKSSWLKYHIKYLVDTNKYFVYPKVSLSTNFTEVGEHAKVKSKGYQVNMQLGNKNYCCAKFDESKNKYDVFFENEAIYRYLNIDKSELCIDLYGNKKNKEKKQFWLTMEQLPFKVIKSFALSLRPHELNVLLDIEGDEIYLYDCREEDNIKRNRTDVSKNKMIYDFKAATKKELLTIAKYYYKEAVKRKIKKVIRG